MQNTFRCKVLLVHHQRQVTLDFRLVPGDVALDCLAGEQLSEKALGDHKVQKLRAAFFFDIVMVLLHLSANIYF